MTTHCAWPPARRRARRAVGRFALEQSVEATARLFAQLTAQRTDPRRIGTLHEARPIRANGSAIKAAAAAPR